MQTVLSQKGQMVIPAKARRLMKVKAGDRLELRVANGELWVRPKRAAVRKLKLVKHPVSGLMCSPPEKGAAIVTETEIRRALADFP